MTAQQLGRLYWPFLVARGRHVGYRSILAPDFLVTAREHGLLAQSIRGGLSDPKQIRYARISPPSVGTVTLAYRADVLTPADLDGQRDQRVTDDHGRPLELLFGLVVRGVPTVGVGEVDLRQAREEAFGAYRRFLTDELVAVVQSSAALVLDEATKTVGQTVRPPPVPVERRAEPARPSAPTSALPARARPVRTRARIAGSLIALGATGVVLLIVGMAYVAGHTRQSVTVTVRGDAPVTITADGHTKTCTGTGECHYSDAPGTYITIESSTLQLVRWTSPCPTNTGPGCGFKLDHDVSITARRVGS